MKLTANQYALAETCRSAAHCDCALSTSPSMLFTARNKTKQMYCFRNFCFVSNSDLISTVCVYLLKIYYSCNYENDSLLL